MKTLLRTLAASGAFAFSTLIPAHAVGSHHGLASAASLTDYSTVNAVTHALLTGDVAASPAHVASSSTIATPATSNARSVQRVAPVLPASEPSVLALTLAGVGIIGLALRRSARRGDANKARGASRFRPA
jgi:hypothetical protein